MHANRTGRYGRAHAVADASKKHLWPLIAFWGKPAIKTAKQPNFPIALKFKVKKSKFGCRIGGRTAASTPCSLMPSAVQHGCRKKLVILDS
jgi:hypothetical protein